MIKSFSKLINCKDLCSLAINLIKLPYHFLGYFGICFASDILKLDYISQCVKYQKNHLAFLLQQTSKNIISKHSSQNNNSEAYIV